MYRKLLHNVFFAYDESYCENLLTTYDTIHIQSYAIVYTTTLHRDTRQPHTVLNIHISCAFLSYELLARAYF
jgi:hypothetical protein